MTYPGQRPEPPSLSSHFLLHQLHQLHNFNIVISLKINSKIQRKKVSLLLDKHLLISNFQLPKTCQDQRLKICVNKLGPSWPVSTERVWGELKLNIPDNMSVNPAQNGGRGEHQTLCQGRTWTEFSPENAKSHSFCCCFNCKRLRSQSRRKYVVEQVEILQSSVPNAIGEWIFQLWWN